MEASLERLGAPLGAIVVSEREAGQRDESERLASVAVHPSSAADAPPREPTPWGWAPSLALGLLGGGAFGLHCLRTDLPWLAWLSTLPWLLLCLHPRARRWPAVLSLALGLHLSWLIGVEFLRGHAFTSWMLGPLTYWPPTLLIWPLCRGLLLRWPRFPPALLWPLVFTGVEWLRVRLSPGEVTLCHLGHSQARHVHGIQVADLVGAGGVSFYLAAATGWIGACLLAGRLFEQPGARRRWLGAQLAGVLALVGFVHAYGALRDSEATLRPGPTVQVVQTLTERSRDEAVLARILDWQVLQTLSTLRPGEVDAVLWPENSVLQPLRKREGLDRQLLAELQGLVDRAGAPLLFDSGWTTDAGVHHHSAFLLDPDGRLQHHWKVRLLPWTEYAPFAGLAGLFGDRAREAWLDTIEAAVGFLPNGTEAPLSTVHPMELRARDGTLYRFGTPICFEIATPRVVNRWHRQGVDFLVNPTSEAALGDSVHAQTLAVCAFRAVEGRVPVVRAANDGISGVVDSNGRVRAVLRGRYTGAPINEPGVLIAQLPLDERGPTLYARFGDWLPVTCLLVSLALAAAGFARRRLARPSRG